MWLPPYQRRPDLITVTPSYCSQNLGIFLQTFMEKDDESLAQLKQLWLLFLAFLDSGQHWTITFNWVGPKSHLQDQLHTWSSPVSPGTPRNSAQTRQLKWVTLTAALLRRRKQWRQQHHCYHQPRRRLQQRAQEVCTVLELCRDWFQTLLVLFENSAGKSFWASQQTVLRDLCAHSWQQQAAATRLPGKQLLRAAAAWVIATIMLNTIFLLFADCYLFWTFPGLFVT